jgi:energy-coupling factor transporter ATP-binding protein EcfA2
MDANEHFTFLGYREGWGQQSPFGISLEDRRQHMFCIGQTGSGKTTLLRNLAVQLLDSGQGIGFIDPHGDEVRKLLDAVPAHRVQNVVYFDPADLRTSVSINLLDHDSPDQREMVASGVVSVFKSIWASSWGPRMEYLLKQSLLALLFSKHSSLYGLVRFLSDHGYRNWVVRQIDDPNVKRFWTQEFKEYEKAFRQEALAPIQNKIGALFLSPALRNVLGQPGKSVDFRRIMDKEMIFLANLSKGRLGEDNARFLGAILVKKFELAALSRANIPEIQRKDFLLVVDEFPLFVTSSFAHILSEARKYRLSLCLAQQFLGQLRDDAEEIKDAIFGNCGSMISFRVGSEDGKILERVFGNAFTAAQLSDQGNHEVCVRIMQQGRASSFQGKTLRPLPCAEGRAKRVLNFSHERFTTRRSVIEQRMHQWWQKRFN